MRQTIWMVAVLGCWLGVGTAQTPPGKIGPDVNKSGAAKSAQSSAANAGEVKFQQNCGRCHQAPQELSPRITGTVVLHMRVRASLSEADARTILRYLAP